MSSYWQRPELSTLHKLAFVQKQQVFLVGGALRDQYLGRAKQDLDFAVSAGAITLARKFSRAIKGAFVLLDEDSGCARVAKKRPDGLWTYDFADFRAKTLKGDLAHRDFTINTLAMDLKDIIDTKTGAKLSSHVVHAPGALSDLKSKTIRMVGARTFNEDPLRLLRAYSLKAQLGFKIEANTLACIKRERNLIKTVSAERVREELFKILGSSRAACVIKGMDRDGMLVEIMPQVRVMYGVKQGGYHHLDVWKHSLEVLVQFERLLKEFSMDMKVKDYLNEELGGGHSRLSVLKLACLLHDIGKPDTRKKEPTGRTSFHTHEHVGRRVARIIAQQLILSTKERHALEDMVTHHLRPGYLSNFKRPSDKAVFRYFRDTKDEAVSIALLAMADQRSTRGPLTTSYDLEHHQDICLGIVKKYFVSKSKKPFVRLLTGHDLIKEIGLKPGPQFSPLLSKVDEAQHLGKVTTKTEALAFVRRNL
jgi:putative nucleotidyltransferase with HDIG domain